MRKAQGRKAGVAALFLIIAGFCFVGFYKAASEGRKRSCQTNLRLLGQAIALYREDYDDCMPLQSAWDGKLPGYGGKVGGCPSARQSAAQPFAGYALNGMFAETVSEQGIVPRSGKEVRFPALTVLVSEQDASVGTATAADPFEGCDVCPLGMEKARERHGGGANYLFFDNRVQFFLSGQVTSCHLVGETYNRNDGKTPSFAL